MAQEMVLWRAVIQRALADATQDLRRVPSSLKRQRLIKERDDARAWLMDGGTDFLEVCSLAGENSPRIQACIEEFKALEWARPSASRRPPDRLQVRRLGPPSGPRIAASGADFSIRETWSDKPDLTGCRSDFRQTKT